MYSNTGGMSRHGLWIKAKHRIEYGRRGDDGAKYLPLPSWRRNEVERIWAMCGRRPVVWASLFVHVLTLYHQEVQRSEEGSEERSKLGENFEDVLREKWNSKMVGQSPWGPGKRPKKF